MKSNREQVRKISEVDLLTKEKKQEQAKIKSQYKHTLSNNVLTEISKEMVVFTKYGQKDIDGNYTSRLDDKQRLALTIWEKPSGLEWLNNLNKDDLKENLENIFKSVDQQTAKLLDVLIIKGTENGFQSPTITLSVKEYAKILNGGEEPTKSQINKAREKAKKGMEALKYIAYTYKPKSRN